MSRSSQHRFAQVTFLLILMSILVSTAAVGQSAPGATQFLAGPKTGDAHDIARAYIDGNLQGLGLVAADLDGMRVSDRYVTKHNGVTHVYFQQTHKGVDVRNALVNVNVARDGSIISLGNRFVGKLATKVNAVSPVLTDDVAVLRAAEYFGLDASRSNLVFLRSEGGVERRAVFSAPALSRDDIPVKLSYVDTGKGGIRLAWETVLHMVDSTDWWNVHVDAETGEVISQHNWSSHDTYRAVPFPAFSDPEDACGAESLPPCTGQTDIVDPADAVASPFGWHDTDGSAGAESTLTRGNNVNAQDDVDANNSGGISVDGGASLEFLVDFDPTVGPADGNNLEAAIVNLFYTNNVMHDLTYHYGFDEAAGNFQANNYGNGGLGNDAVEADAQDGSDTGNATFGTPPDGFAPRMSMFRWLAFPNATLTINSPGGIAGDYVAGAGDWGGALEPNTTADIEDTNDGSANPTEGCNALVGFTAGNIALIDRGTCEFGVKAQNAENAGAVGVIIVNNQNLPNGIIPMGAGAVGASVTIPAVMIGNADGTTIRSALATRIGGASVNGTLGPNAALPDRDSDFDNGIVAHEYGHGISNRLTGGPSNVGCLGGSEQAGEGWSDFWTLMLTAKAEDTPTTSKGVGNYVIFEPVNGPGIRNFPYTTDLSVNPQTYSDIGSTNVPHGVGEIWMDMVWDMYWELVIKHGFDEDFYFGTGGNNMTIQLVMDGMKMQPCTPTFVDARDAILAADLANSGGENSCEIWRAFARRGAGVNAVDGSANAGDETNDFTIPAECPTEQFSSFADDFESSDTSGWPVAVGLSP